MNIIKIENHFGIIHALICLRKSTLAEISSRNVTIGKRSGSHCSLNMK